MTNGPRVIEGPFDDLNEEEDQKPPLEAAQNNAASKATFGDMTNEEYVVHNIIECNVNSSAPSIDRSESEALDIGRPKSGGVDRDISPENI